MHGVHAIREWLIPADFRPEYLREAQGEGAMGANLRSRMGRELRRFGWDGVQEFVIASEAKQSRAVSPILIGEALDFFASLAMTG